MRQFNFNKKNRMVLINCGKCDRKFNRGLGIPCDNFDMCKQYICRQCRPLININIKYYCKRCEPHFKFQDKTSNTLLQKIAIANDLRYYGNDAEAAQIENEIVKELL